MSPAYPEFRHGSKPRSGWSRGGAWCCLGWLLLLAGCAPAEPLEAVVDARSPIAFQAWQNRYVNRSEAAERARWETALQEIRLKIMADREATGSDPISEALRAKVDGRPVREVLQLGWELRLSRLLQEHAALHDVMRKNAMLQTREGDKASEDYLVNFHQKQAARLEKLEAEIEASQQVVEPLLKSTGRSLLPNGPDGTPVLLKPGKWRA